MSAAERWGVIGFPTLYYIHTFSGVGKAERAALYGTCLPIVQGGGRLIQLRYKGAWSAEVADTLRLFIHDFEGSDCRFLLNDRAEWAREAGAHGVHVGEQGDTPPADARRMLGPRALIGATTKTPEQLNEAIAAKVDYISYGALFPSATKPEAVPGTLERIPELRAAIPEGMRLCVIGGITREHIDRLFRTPGVDLVAVGAALQNAEDPELETIKLLDAIRIASGSSAGSPAPLVASVFDHAGEDVGDEEE